MDTWVDSIRNVQSTCSGVLESARRSWVSVSSLIGIRFKIKICSGRISWLIARFSSITKIFSDSRMALAGRSFCTLIGIVFFSHHVQEILLRDNRDSQFFRFFIL